MVPVADGPGLVVLAMFARCPGLLGLLLGLAVPQRARPGVPNVLLFVLGAPHQLRHCAAVVGLQGVDLFG